MFESHWRAQAVPFRLAAAHRGVRRRVHAEFVRPDGGPDWLVRYYVQRQVIGDMTAAFDPQEEDWEEAGQDPDTELRIEVKLRSRFGVEAPPPVDVNQP